MTGTEAFNSFSLHRLQAANAARALFIYRRANSHALIFHNLTTSTTLVSPFATDFCTYRTTPTHLLS